ncbi:MAG TPA: deaminase, partial [Candidatus Saccharimonas sp.]|nr:deaminase [Candidatus Saccharimonas sp.]
GPDFTRDWPILAKENRALEPKLALSSLQAIYPRLRLRIIGPADLPSAVTATTLIAPAEDLLRHLISHYHLDQGRDVQYDPTFLRWDRDSSRDARPVQLTPATPLSELDQSMLGLATDAARRSSDWWRQVGAVAATPTGPLVAHNHHLPTPYAPYISGDPRNNFRRGEYLQLSTAIHAEAAIIAQAARRGISLQRTTMFVTTFPCPACARLIAETGIAKLYVADAYSLLDGADILATAGVEIIWVKT